MMKLTPEERETIIRQMREEAIDAVRKLGCTCQPEPATTLSKQGVGRYDLPMWISEHPDDCPACRAAH